MKGATIGHAKQRLSGGRYLGFTEPGIIAAESPNAIVNNLVILPDIEKRLEAFVRAGARPAPVTRAEVIVNPGNTVVQGTMIQAVTGQFYVAVVVAIFVGMYSRQRQG